MTEQLALNIAIILPALCVGSFLATIAVRLPLGEGFVSGRSRCPRCRTKLSFADLIPVASWLFQRGRCRHCNAPISSLYAITEIATAVVAVWSFSLFQDWGIAASCLLGGSLLVLAVIDARHHILPDVITIPLIAVGLLLSLLDGEKAAMDYAIGALVGFALFAGITYFYRIVLGREGLGLGDAKLIAAAGAWLGWAALPSVIFFSAITALIGTLTVSAVTKSNPNRFTVLAFGPYIALSFWFHWVTHPADIFSVFRLLLV